MHRVFGMAMVIGALTGGMACAAEPPVEKKSKPSKSEKVMVMLAAVGLDSREVRSIVDYVDEHAKDGYFHLAEERMAGGIFKLHYALEGGIDSEQLELRYTPDESHFIYTARPTGAMVQYQLKF